MVRDWRNAAAEIKRNLATEPRFPISKIGLAQIEVVANFDLAAARAKLREIPAGVDPDGVVTLAKLESKYAGTRLGHGGEVVGRLPVRRVSGCWSKEFLSGPNRTRAWRCGIGANPF